MSNPNKKNVKTDLESWAIIEGQLKSLQEQRAAAIEPIQTKFNTQIAKATVEFDSQISKAQAEKSKLEANIIAEFKKGFDAKENRYVTKSIDSDLALVEVNSSETREIDAAAWLKEVPKADKEKPGFWETFKVQIGKAEKFRSDLVAKLATKKISYSISIRLK